MDSAVPRHVAVDGVHLTGRDGSRLTMQGFCLGGWMCMENFIAGYPATETLVRQAVARAAGSDRARFFFDRLLDKFFTDDDAAFLASLGVNALRIAISYRHFEDDMAPRVLKPGGLERLDRAIEACARHGIYSIIDLHAVPGWQNMHWHCDNDTHRALFWRHRDFQDRAVWLWEVLADHYKDNTWVAGYNLLNEPADETGEAVGPFYRRLAAAIRAIDPRHVFFVDGNSYATDFSVFSEPWDNTVYTCHDYAAAGLEARGEYPGHTRGRYADRQTLEDKFAERTAYARSLGTPLYVGEFGPIYTSDPARNEQLYALLDDQLEIYRDAGASWSLWMYKDMGRQGLVGVAASSPYARAVTPIVAKKDALATDHWGADFERVADLLDPIVALVKDRFPGFDPYPWGADDWVHTMIPHLLFAQPMVDEYAALFAGLDEEALVPLADSFALASCVVREPLRARVAAETARRPG